MARFDPDKRWLAAVDLVAEMKRRGSRPLLLARGGVEGHREDVLAAARARRLRVAERSWTRPGAEGLVEAASDPGDADVVELRSHVDPSGRRVLFRAADAVLANSGHEPFGLVGLEAMAAGGVVCTGCSGEDYAVPGHNALVLQTGDPREFLGLFSWVRSEPERERGLRRAAAAAARRYAWPQIVQRVMLPQLAVRQERPIGARAVRAPRRARPRATAPVTLVPSAP
jgi:glycosyltransferase involved in cell wall biosynthesis